MSDLFLSYLEITLPTSIIIIIFLLTNSLFKKRYKAKTYYYIWIILAIRLILPFDFIFNHKTAVSISIDNKPIYSENINEEHIYTNDNITNASHFKDDNTVTTYEHFPTKNTIVKEKTVLEKIKDNLKYFSTLEIISFIWCSGVFILIVKYFLKYLTVSKTLRKNCVYDSSANSILLSVSSDIGIKKYPQIYKTTYVLSPIIVGIFSPKIYIPFTDIPDNHLEMILRHELTHYKRHDIFYKFIIYLSCCIHWFNPVVWIMNNKSQQDIEISCDEDVLKNKDIEFKNLYCNSIMFIAKSAVYKKMSFSTGFADSKKILKERFHSIYDKNIKHIGKGILYITIILSIICSSFIAFNNIPKNDNKIPEQAMNFINFYTSLGLDDDSVYLDNDNYYFGFVYLYSQNLLSEKYIYGKDNHGNIDSFKVPNKTMMDIYQFISADKLPLDWWLNENYDIFASDYLTYNYELTPLNVEFTTENGKEILYAEFKRTAIGTMDNRYPVSNIKFTMEKQIVDTVPLDLQSQFNVGDEIWRIKNVEYLHFNQNSNISTITINTKEDFLNFAKDISENAPLRKGNTYILGADIDMEGIKISPIGLVYDGLDFDYNISFESTFDGNNHTISNLIVVYDENEKYINNVGLFRELGENGEIKNLNIENITVMPKNQDNNYRGKIGGICGFSKGEITNCNLTGTIIGYSSTGGLVGMNYGEITDCKTNATVEGYNSVGNLVGCSLDSKISNCSANGTVIAKQIYSENIENSKISYIGGFAGTISSSSIYGCDSNVKLIVEKPYKSTGYFSGTSENSSIVNSTYNQNSNYNLLPIGYSHNSYLNLSSKS